MNTCCHHYNKTKTIPWTRTYLLGSIPDSIKSVVGSMTKMQQCCEDTLASLIGQIDAEKAVCTNAYQIGSYTVSL